MNRKNSIYAIRPYWDKGSLVFDDERVGLVQEPFVGGADVILGALASTVPGCKKKFVLVFSEKKFPGWQWTLQLVGPEYGGNWYRCVELGEEAYGWLCPALFLYFPKAPKDIFIQIKEDTCER